MIKIINQKAALNNCRNKKLPGHSKQVWLAKGIIPLDVFWKSYCS